MASVLALISKAEFDKRSNHGRALDGLSRSFYYDRYESSHPALATLASGGDLFLVTVRPPNDALWLIAIIGSPKRKGGAWVGRRSTVPATKITALRDKLRFETGAGLSTRVGALAMSLQTPRALTKDAVTLLRSATKRPKPDAAPPAHAKPKAAKPAARTGGTLPLLIAAALSQIEDEYLDRARQNPAKLIARGDFSTTVQSVLSGSIDTPKRALAILDELAPFARGSTIVRRLHAEAKKNDATVLSLLNELVDGFAVSTIDVMGAALVAMASGNPDAIPASAVPYEKALAPHAARLRKTL